MRRTFCSILCALLAVVICVSCDDYDKWTVSPSAKLSFSTDTLSFDTVISTLSSPTKTMLVWNRNDAGVRIDRIQLKGAPDSHFRVNVDGSYLIAGMGDDFEVRRSDSIFVKVEVMLPETDSDEPVHYSDELVFYLESGVTQSVVLEADGQDVYVLRGEVWNKDMRLSAVRPFLIYDSLVVGEGATLTIDPGACLMFHDSVSLMVHGRLLAEGTLERPITFRGDRLDRLFEDLPYDNTSNRWGGIHFFGTSFGNVMTQCDVHSGRYGLLLDRTIDIGQTSAELALLMTDCIIHNIEGHAFQATDTSAEVYGTQISNALGHVVALMGGAYTFVHCTIAQYYPWSAGYGDALNIANTEDEDSEDSMHPLYWADFLNSVIMGRAEDVIMGKIVEYQDYPCKYLFQNCYLRTVDSEDESRFVNVVYDRDTLDYKKDDPERPKRFGSKNFTVMGEHYLYDFTPDSLSGICGLADPNILKKYNCLYDRKGNSRLADGTPDAGAYEFVRK